MDIELLTKWFISVDDGHKSFKKTFSPDLVLISAGFDGHKDDTTMAHNFELEDKDYLWIAGLISKNVCRNVVSVLEGGYLEKSLTYGQKISGHFTQGHVDSVGKIQKVKIIDKTWIVSFKILNKNLTKYLMEKASISINGVSLTISKVTKNSFEINVIPHTLKLTNLQKLKSGNLVNVELDIFSKYIQKYTN